MLWIKSQILIKRRRYRLHTHTHTHTQLKVDLLRKFLLKDPSFILKIHLHSFPFEVAQAKVIDLWIAQNNIYEQNTKPQGWFIIYNLQGLDRNFDGPFFWVAPFQTNHHYQVVNVVFESISMYIFFAHSFIANQSIKTLHNK